MKDKTWSQLSVFKHDRIPLGILLAENNTGPNIDPRGAPEENAAL